MKLVLLALAFLAVAFSDDCVDKGWNCENWGEMCATNDYVQRQCPKTCHLCEPAPPTVPPGPMPSINPVGACGKPQVQLSRVIAGDNAKRGAWPWQILMLFNNQPECGGSIIANKWIVTAAHCVYRRENQPYLFKVRVGEHDQNVKEGSEVDMQVEKVLIHEQYNKGTRNNDIALFKLTKPILFNQWVQPVCLPEADVQPGHECYITGWGKIKDPGNMHAYLQQAMMPAVSNSVCHAKNYRSLGIPVTDDMICGGDGGQTMKSGCQGDSGGPYVCKVKSGRWAGRWELHGDVSHGSSTCNSSQSYSVFARTFYFKKWIEDKIKQYGL